MTDTPDQKAALDALLRLVTSAYGIDIRNAMEIDEDEAIIKAALMQGGVAQFVPTHRHKKRGTEYQYIGVGTIQANTPLPDYANVVIYKGADGQLWARAYDEFHDGRFEALNQPPREGE